MGGNALSKPADSMTSSEYSEAVAFVLSKFNQFFDNTRITVPAQLKFKTTFGDLDFIVEHNFDKSVMQKFLTQVSIEQVLKGKEDNESGVSFGIELNNKLIQVDFIYANSDEFEFTAKFYGHGDLSVFMATLFRAAGFLFNSEGLWYVVDEFDKSRAAPLILISRDWDFCLEAIGLNPVVYHEGFDSFNAMFEFLSSSPYFSRSSLIHKLEGKRSSKSVEKRPTYAALYEWLKKLPDSPRDFFLPISPSLLCPSFESQLKDIRFKEMTASQIKSKFNGQIVKEATGLEGVSLGEFISKFKEFVEQSHNTDFNSYILETTSKDIVFDILKIYQGYS